MLHAALLDAPMALLNRPTLQLLQLFAAHDPFAVPYFPAPHIMHVAAAFVSWYLPSGQSMQLADPPAEYCPTRHRLQMPRSAVVPGRQLVQNGWPGCAAPVPAGQRVHSEAELFEYHPRLHDLQVFVDAPTVRDHCPAGQALQSVSFPAPLAEL